MSKWLSTSVLEYADKAEVGFHTVTFSGSGYTGNDLPKSDTNYKYGTGTIIKRQSDVITVVLWGAVANHTPIFNLKADAKWNGWKKFDGTPVT